VQPLNASAIRGACDVWRANCGGKEGGERRGGEKKGGGLWLLCSAGIDADAEPGRGKNPTGATNLDLTVSGDGEKEEKKKKRGWKGGARTVWQREPALQRHRRVTN